MTHIRITDAHNLPSPRTRRPKRKLRSLEPSGVRKYSLIIHGHKTSVSLEKAFHSYLKEYAIRHDTTVNAVVTEIDDAREHGNLSSAVRLFILADAKAQMVASPPISPA